MTPEQRKQLVRQLIEEVVRTGHTEPMRAHPGLQEVMPNIERATQALSERTVSFPLQFTEGEWVATRAVFRGIHTGPGYGSEPTGNPVEYEVLMFNRVVDGVIVQQHSQVDVRSIMEQVGQA